MNRIMKTGFMRGLAVLMAGFMVLSVFDPLTAAASDAGEEENVTQISADDTQSQDSAEEVIADHADAPVVTEVYQDSSHDNGGEYFYLYVTGFDLTRENAVPTLYRNGVKAAECTGETVYSDPWNDDVLLSYSTGLRNPVNMTFQLRKLSKDTLWSFSEDESPEFEVRFPEDTAVIEYKVDRVTIEKEEPVLFHKYNYKKNTLEVWLRDSAGIKDGTSVTVYIFDNYDTSYMDDDSQHIDTTQALGKRTAKVNGDKLVFSNVTDADLMSDFQKGYGGTDWYYFDFGPSIEKQIVSNVGVYDACNRSLTHERMLYGTPRAGETSADVAFLLDSSVYGNKTKITASYEIYYIDGAEEKYPFVLTKNTSFDTSTLDVPSGFAIYTGTIKNDSGFKAFDKKLVQSEAYYIDNIFGSSSYYAIHALDGRFYQSGQESMIWADGTVTVDIVSESAGIDYDKAGFSFAKRPTAAQSLAYWNENGYKVEVFDQDYNPVQTDPDSLSVYWDRNSIHLAVSTNLHPVYDNENTDRNYVYVKVTKNGEIGRVPHYGVVNDTVCETWYEYDFFSDEQYGLKVPIIYGSRVIPNTSDYSEWEISNDNSYVGLYLRPIKHALPVRAYIFEPGSEDAVLSINVTQSDLNENGHYYFKESDVSKLDPKAIYRICFTSDKYGCFGMYSGYISYRGAPRSDGAKTPASDTKPIAVSKCAITLPKSRSYTGREIVLSSDELTVKRSKNDRTAFIPGEDYTVRYESNTAVGTATVYVEGVTKEDGSGLTGRAKKTFKITPAKFEESDTVQYRITAPDEVPFAKGGAVLPAVIEWTSNGGETWTTLNEGVDYKLSFKNNKTVNTNGLMTVKGLGNFKGSILKDIRRYAITEKNMSAVYAFSPDKSYSASKKGTYYQSAPVIYDTNGKKLAAKKDYKVIKYIRENGEVLDKNSTAVKGETFFAVVEGQGAYTGTINVPYKATDQVLNITKAKVGKIMPQTYTGAFVDLKANGAFPQITIGNIPVNESETDGYQILGYVNNLSKGTASVIVKGTGSFCGIRLITFKIVS